MNDLKQTLIDLNLLSEPSNDSFRIEVIESMVDNVLLGKLKLIFENGQVAYSMTEHGKNFVENMGNSEVKEKDDDA